MRSIFVDGHRLRDAGVHLRTAAGDLGIPYLCGAGLGFRIETADQFERESGTLLDGKAEDFGDMLSGMSKEDDGTAFPGGKNADKEQENEDADEDLTANLDPKRRR